jgi:hypothetical protein
MKLDTHVDQYLVRLCVERHCHATRIARDIGDRRCAAEATLRVSGGVIDVVLNDYRCVM